MLPKPGARISWVVTPDEGEHSRNPDIDFARRLTLCPEVSLGGTCHVLPRHHRNYAPPDVDEAWFVAANFMERRLHECDAYRLSTKDGYGENSGRVAG